MCSCLHNTNKTTRVVFIFIFFVKATFEKKYAYKFHTFFNFQMFEPLVFFRTNKKNPPGSTEPLGSHKVKQRAHMHSTGTCVGSRCRWGDEPAVSVHGAQNGTAKRNSSGKGGGGPKLQGWFYFILAPRTNNRPARERLAAWVTRLLGRARWRRRPRRLEVTAFSSFHSCQIASAKICDLLWFNTGKEQVQFKTSARCKVVLFFLFVLDLKFFLIICN